MTLAVEVQVALPPQDVQAYQVPGKAAIGQWVQAALPKDADDMELVVRIVDASEAAGLNEQYRHRSGPTNVLSFPMREIGEHGVQVLGDIVICAPLVWREAREQKKTPAAHWAHLVVHGALHLLGYDHEDHEQAGVMESRETDILTSLGFPNPYKPIAPAPRKARG